MTHPPPPPPPTIPHSPFTFLPPNPNPNSESDSLSSQLQSPHLQSLSPNLPLTLSSLDDLIHRSEETLRWVFDLLPLQNPYRADSDGLVSCPFDSRHVMPPNCLFSHSLRCSSSQSPLQLDLLLPRLNYPETLKPSSSSQAGNGTIRTLHGSGSELCFSLDDFYADFGSSFFYRDCHGVVNLSSLDGIDRTSNLPLFLSVECRNFESNDEREAKGIGVDQRKILPSELWAIRAEVEAWNEYPGAYSYRVLCAILSLNVLRECDLVKWIIANSPRYGVVIDEAMRDHIFLLCRLCLKAIQKEALDSSMENRDSGMTLGRVNFNCPVLVQALMWLASQLSVLYGEMGGIHFAIKILKQCVLDAASDLLIFSFEKDSKESSVLEEVPRSIDASGNEIKCLDVGKPLEIGINGEPSKIVEESVTGGVIFLSQVAAAIAALHERSLLEQKTKGQRFHQPLNNYQRMAENNYLSQRADEERRRRPQYRPIIEHDGLPRLRISNEETSKTKTREELLAEERDYKRRRMSYRGKKVKRSKLEVTRDIIEDYMDEIKQAGGIGCFEKDIQREEAHTLKTPFSSEMTTYIDMPKESNCESSMAGDNSPNCRRKQPYTDSSTQSTSSKGHIDRDYEQPSRYHYSRHKSVEDERSIDRDKRNRGHEFIEDERSIGRDKQDREYYSRSSRHDRSSDQTRKPREQNDMDVSTSRTNHHDSKQPSSRTSKYHGANRSSTSVLTAEYKSNSRNRRQRDSYESYSSESLSRNRFEDRYDPSESRGVYEDDISANDGKYVRDKFYGEK